MVTHVSSTAITYAAKFGKEPLLTYTKRYMQQKLD